MKPILFSGPMVRAILEGRKTQTRRIVKPQPFMVLSAADWHSRAMSGVDPYGCRPMGSHVLEEMGATCPHGTVGDRLWVREAWAPAEAALPLLPGVLYRADDHTGLEKREGDHKWKPSIHMKRAASRITLEITGVRVERLQEISGDDAKAEGVQPIPFSNGTAKVIWEPGYGASGQDSYTPAFQSLWQSINKPESWSANPWVWVIEFRRVDNG